MMVEVFEKLQIFNYTIIFVFSDFSGTRTLVGPIKLIDTYKE